MQIVLSKPHNTVYLTHTFLKIFWGRGNAEWQSIKTEPPKYRMINHLKAEKFVVFADFC